MRVANAISIVIIRYTLDMIDVSGAGGGSGVGGGGVWRTTDGRKSSSEQSPLSLNSTPTTPAEFPSDSPSFYSPDGSAGSTSSPPAVTPTYTSRLNISPLHIATLPHHETSPYARRSRLASSQPSISGEHLARSANASADVSQVRLLSRLVTPFLSRSYRLADD